MTVPPGQGAKSFAARMKVAVEQSYRKDARRVAVEVGIKMNGKVILRTPVDTGRTRANWIGSLGEGEGVSAINLGTDKSGRQTIAAANAVAKSQPPYAVFTQRNNMEHVNVLEVGGFVPENPGPSKKKGKGGKDIKGRTGKVLVLEGFSVQAPDGMVAVSVNEIIAEGVGAAA